MPRNFAMFGLLLLFTAFSNSSEACISDLASAVKSRAVYNLPVPFEQLCPELREKILGKYNYEAVMPVFTKFGKKPPVATASFLGFTEEGLPIFAVSAHVTRAADVDFVIAGSFSGQNVKIYLKSEPIYTSEKGDLSIVIGDSERLTEVGRKILSNTRSLKLNGESTTQALAQVSERIPPLLLGWANYDALLKTIGSQPEFWQGTEAESAWTQLHNPLSVDIMNAEGVVKSIRVTPVINIAKILAGGMSGLQVDGDGLLVGSDEIRGAYLREEPVLSDLVAYVGRSGGGMSGSPIISGDEFGDKIFITHGTKGNPPMLKDEDGKILGPHFELLAAREDLIDLLWKIMNSSQAKFDSDLIKEIENMERRFRQVNGRYPGQDTLERLQSQVFESLLNNAQAQQGHSGHTLQTRMTMVYELLTKLLRGDIPGPLLVEFTWAYGNSSAKTIQDLSAAKARNFKKSEEEEKAEARRSSTDEKKESTHSTELKHSVANYVIKQSQPSSCLSRIYRGAK